jgi:predicted MFS family arabinose efflux permease
MRIGTSIGLIALGLILALAVRVDLGGIDLELVGWILTIVGVVGLVASLALARQVRPVVRREAEYPPPPPPADPRYPDPRY